MTHPSTVLLRLEDHGAPVCSAVFSADGKRVEIEGEDKTARIWGVETGHCLRTLVPMADGWFTLDEHGRYRGTPEALEHLTYYDPQERSLLPTLWYANDLPELREPDPEPDSSAVPKRRQGGHRPKAMDIP